MNTTHNAPEARIVSVKGLHVTVECPYCGHEHKHSLTVPRGYQRLAPTCGMTCSPDQRSNGYWFTITK